MGGYIDYSTGEILETKSRTISINEAVDILMGESSGNGTKENGKVFRDMPLARSEDDMKATAKWYYDRARSKALKES